ncbi:S8 family serine peptidase [Caldisericum sp. AR60]|uniref:S8 family serine peptidase n=1 Tax=Caldisericum sp. AR60 TaxID=3397852 RepID=UPI0039FD2E6A
MKKISISVKRFFNIFVLIAFLLSFLSPTKAIVIPKKSVVFNENKTYKAIVVLSEPPVLDYKDSFSYRFLSVFGVNSLENYSNSLKTKHISYKKALEDLGLKVSYDYSYVLNGVSIEGSGKALNKILDLDFVKNIYEERQYKLERDITSKVIKSDLVNLLKDQSGNLITGNNIKIGIIDTGVDYTHKELGGGKFPNLKVIGGYDFADNDPDPMDYDGHGTHVAGIAAGSEKGIAENAKIYAYKVFSKNSTTTTSSLIIKALDQAVKDKCDVVNISIGLTNGGATSDDPESQAVRRAVNSGVVVVAAAGNNGVSSEFFEYPISSPASVDLAIGVGASSDGITGIINSYGRKIIAQYPNESPDFIEGDYQIVYCGLGRKEDFANIDVKGRIALIERGQIYFGDKDLNAKDAGAVGVIVYNNVSGMPKITLVSQSNPSRNDFIPFLFVSFTDGQFLKEHIDERISINNVYGLGLIAEFSSQGPTSDFYLKPDLVAPGVNISSTYLNNSYAEMSGTSMASPVVAGSVALIKQAKPNLQSQEIKYLLMNTADILYNPSSSKPFSPTLQGSGRVNVYNAVNANAVVYPSSLIFGNGIRSKVFSLTIKNFGNTTKTFSTSIINASNDPISINLPSSITVSGNSSVTFNVTLSASSDVIDSYGFIFFDSGFEKLHIPYVYLKDNKPRDPIYNVNISSNNLSPQTSSKISFSVGVGSVGSSESYKFRESVAEEVKISILDSKGNIIKDILDIAPIYVGDYSVTFGPFDPVSSSYILENGIYYYKISYIEANDDENSKQALPTLEKFVKSGYFWVSGFGSLGKISLDLPNGIAPLMNIGDVLPINLDISGVKPFKSLSFEIHFDTTKLSLINLIPVNELILVSSNQQKNAVNIQITSENYISDTTIKLTFKALENGGGFINVYRPTSDSLESYYTKGINFKISEYSKFADLNGDKKVDSQDLAIFKSTFGLTKDNAKFNPRCDLNFDGIIDEKDFYIFAKHFGELYP